jgi:hypothetical protein
LLFDHFPGADFPAESVAAAHSSSTYYPGSHAASQGYLAADVDADGCADVPAINYTSARYARANTHAAGFTHADKESGPADEVALQIHGSKAACADV